MRSDRPPSFLHLGSSCLLCQALGEPCHVAYTYLELVPGGQEPLGLAILWPMEVRGRAGHRTVEQGRLAFPLGEVTGVYHCQAEHAIAVMQQIQYDILIKEPVFYNKYQKEMDLLRKGLLFLRMRIFIEALISYNKNHLISNFSNYVDLTWKINEVSGKIFKAEMKSKINMAIWGRFMVYLEALNHWFTFVPPLMRISRLKDETFAKANLSETLELARSEDHSPLLTSLLAAAQGPLPSFKFLLNLVCGDLDKKKGSCVGGCSRRFKVETFIPRLSLLAVGLQGIGSVFEEKNLSKGVATVELDFEKIFCCGNRGCVPKVIPKRMTLMKYHLDLEAFAERYSKSVCDFCFQAVERIHRCGRCKTKMYCNKRCVEKDWRQGHQEACPQLKGDKLREKEGKEERRERGAEAVEHGMATAQSMDGLMDMLNTLVPGGLVDMEAKRSYFEDVTQRMKNL